MEWNAPAALQIVPLFLSTFITSISRQREESGTKFQDGTMQLKGKREREGQEASKKIMYTSFGTGVKLDALYKFSLLI